MASGLGPGPKGEARVFAGLARHLYLHAETHSVVGHGQAVVDSG